MLPAISVSVDLGKVHSQIAAAKKATAMAHQNAMYRMGLMVEAEAVVIVTKASGRLAQSIHTLPPEYDRILDQVIVWIVADTAYAIYVEQGFQGHFIPFDKAPSLYAEALTRWGWRVPFTPVKNPKPGRRYLQPPNSKSPAWGVYVSGDAHPFLRPALHSVDSPAIRNRILSEELTKAYRALHVVSG